jgi:hypothetical protein
VGRLERDRTAMHGADWNTDVAGKEGRHAMIQRRDTSNKAVQSDTDIEWRD